jgi:hypothetical protein
MRIRRNQAGGRRSGRRNDRAKRIEQTRRFVADRFRAHHRGHPDFMATSIPTTCGCRAPGSVYAVDTTLRTRGPGRDPTFARLPGRRGHHPHADQSGVIRGFRRALIRDVKEAFLAGYHGVRDTSSELLMAELRLGVPGPLVGTQGRHAGAPAALSAFRAPAASTPSWQCESHSSSITPRRWRRTDETDAVRRRRSAGGAHGSRTKPRGHYRDNRRGGTLRPAVPFRPAGSAICAHQLLGGFEERRSTICSPRADSGASCSTSRVAHVALRPPPAGRGSIAWSAPTSRRKCMAVARARTPRQSGLLRLRAVGQRLICRSGPASSTA